jgi:hypothetical protein
MIEQVLNVFLTRVCLSSSRLDFEKARQNAAAIDTACRVMAFAEPSPDDPDKEQVLVLMERIDRVMMDSGL